MPPRPARPNEERGPVPFCAASRLGAWGSSGIFEHGPGDDQRGIVAVRIAASRDDLGGDHRAELAAAWSSMKTSSRSAGTLESIGSSVSSAAVVAVVVPDRSSSTRGSVDLSATSVLWIRIPYVAQSSTAVQAARGADDACCGPAKARFSACTQDSSKALSRSASMMDRACATGMALR